MNYIDITSLIDFFKFGSSANTIDLIYLFVILKFFIWPLLISIYNFIKRRCS